MARHLSLESAIDKNRIASVNAWILLLDIEVFHESSTIVAETIRIARNNENVTYQGHLYTAAHFDAETRDSAEGVPEAKLTVQDPTHEVIARMEAYGGGVGFRVRLRVVNSGNLAQPPEIEDLFYVKSARVSSHTAEFTLGARNPLGQRFPRRLQFRDRCPWLYKGPECGYQGPRESCDYTLQGPNGCAVHDNTENFGGFPGLVPR